MLPLDKCRKILNQPNLEDDAVDKIRNQLYAIAELLVSDFLKNKQVDELESDP
ncbi:MAG: hypothetical protein OEV49_07645 [candidate division Zixibacteria bacterium]|nr:hypothetical protein [candidate division Zixibacteria bacterium]MDH3938214.1 hypothetical protein [candidate division Zixibacteria bacterium]MDH4035733.1 hypothetical protein [candidate division Zixibacteria bacterium]